MSAAAASSSHLSQSSTTPLPAGASADKVVLPAGPSLVGIPLSTVIRRVKDAHDRLRRARRIFEMMRQQTVVREREIESSLRGFVFDVLSALIPALVPNNLQPRTTHVQDKRPGAPAPPTERTVSGSADLPRSSTSGHGTAAAAAAAVNPSLTRSQSDQQLTARSTTSTASNGTTGSADEKDAERAAERAHDLQCLRLEQCLQKLHGALSSYLRQCEAATPPLLIQTVDIQAAQDVVKQSRTLGGSSTAVLVTPSASSGDIKPPPSSSSTSTGPNGKALSMCLYYVARYLSAIDQVLREGMDRERGPAKEFTTAQIDALFILRTKLEAVMDVLPLAAQMPLSDVCLDPARPWISNVELHLRPADPAQFQRDLDGFLHAIAFGASFVDSGFHYKNPFLRTWMMGYGMVYYGINSDAARSRGELVYARGNVKLQKMLWNLPDSSMIRGFFALGIPSIEVHESFRIPRPASHSGTPGAPLLISSAPSANTSRTNDSAEPASPAAANAAAASAAAVPYPPIPARLLSSKPLPIEPSFAKLSFPNMADSGAKRSSARDPSRPSSSVTGLQADDRNWPHAQPHADSAEDDSDNASLSPRHTTHAQRSSCRSCFGPDVEAVEEPPPARAAAGGAEQRPQSSAQLPAAAPTARAPHKDGTVLLHFHGGGFIGMSSFSHQSYTRQWVNATDIPMVSVDYRLAPEHPFPAAIVDCWHAYRWVVEQGCQLLGVNPKHIILAGDSAGGNLVVAVTIYAIVTGYHHIPDGLLLAYPALRLEASFSPSLLLSMDDRMVPYTFLLSCLDAYIGLDPDAGLDDVVVERDPSGRATAVIPDPHPPQVRDTLQAQRLLEQQAASSAPSGSSPARASSPTASAADHARISFDNRSCKNPIVSPIYTPDSVLRKFPPCRLLVGDKDPLHDDCIRFTQRLVDCGVDVRLRVYEGFPHGFLNLDSNFNSFSGLRVEARKAVANSVTMIEELAMIAHQRSTAGARATGGTS